MPEVALAMLTRALDTGVPAAWVAGDRAKGSRLHDWARVPIRPLSEPGRYRLLGLRSLTNGEPTHYLCLCSPAVHPLAAGARVSGSLGARLATVDTSAALVQPATISVCPFSTVLAGDGVWALAGVLVVVRTYDHVHGWRRALVGLVRVGAITGRAGLSTWPTLDRRSAMT